MIKSKYEEQSDKGKQKGNPGGSGEDGCVVDGWVWTSGGTGVE